MFNIIEQIFILCIVVTGLLTIIFISSLTLNNLLSDSNQRVKLVCIKKNEELLLTKYRKMTYKNKQICLTLSSSKVEQHK